MRNLLKVKFLTTWTEDIQMIASALPLILVLASVVVLGVTGNLFSSSPFVIAPQVAAVLLSVWARTSFQQGTFRVTAAPNAASVITRGPYGFIRHPMYSAALLFIWAGVLGHLSAFTVAIGVAATVLCVIRVNVEERLLRATYPDYLNYSESTNALIPYIF